MRVRVLVALALTLSVFTALPSSQQAGTSGATTVPGELLVQFTPGATASERAQAHRAAGATVLGTIARTRVERVRVPRGSEAAAIERYRRNPLVSVAEPHHLRSIPAPLSHGDDPPLIPADFHFGEQWALHNTGQLFYCFIPGWCLYVGTRDADIDAVEAWATTTGSAVTVAVIDSGIDYTHPDLAANYLGGYDYFNNDADPMDDHGHGTHVAGTIAAPLNNPTGNPGDEEGVVGVAPNARILAYKVCGSSGSCSDFAIQQAIASAIDGGARVINMSLGQTAYSQTLCTAVQDAWNAGIVTAAGAGNNGLEQLFYPAACPGALAVGAFDEDHLRAGFSNFGTWVHLSAPGNAVLSTYPGYACGGLGTTPGDIGCYNWLSGTSMATPHVAGAAALVWSRADIATNDQVVEALLESADRVGVSATRLDSWTQYGGLNLHDAMSYGVTNQAPVANAGPDQVLTDTDGSGAESVTLNGSASADPDGTIGSYEWRENGAVIATGAVATVSLAVGVHVVTLIVTDGGGATGTDSVTITIQPRPVATDTVTIVRALYNTRRTRLNVEATSSWAPNVTLSAYDASGGGQVFMGTLQYDPGRTRYIGSFTRPTAPSAIRVVSSGGGSATGGVTVR